MYRISSLLLTNFLVLAIAVMVAGVGRAEIPRKMNYQGRLTDSATGEPSPGYHDVTFQVFEDAVGGVALWTETHGLTTDSSGVFSVILGNTTPMDVMFAGPVWLEVTVDGDVLLPRREIVSVPFAFLALGADSLGGHGPGDFVLAGDMGSITGEMISDGEITDADIDDNAGIDPAKVAGTAWTSENDGSGSGLDADMVDGLNADAFSDTGHAHDGRYHTKEELSTEGTINAAGNPVDWTKLKGVPGSLADGVDDVGSGDGHSLDAVDGDPVDAVYVDVDGNVGVGTTEPALGKLTVVTQSGTGVYASSPDGISIFGHSPDGTGVSGSSTSGLAGSFSGDVYVSDALGVGTSTPAEELDVAGDINVTTSYMIGGRRALYAPAGQSLVVGRNACGGRAVSRVTVVGDSAGYSCTEGGNTLVGVAAGRSTTTGYSNVFVGDYAGYNNETGHGNTFIGAGAGQAIRYASGNTFVGSEAGVKNLDVGHNTFIGSKAGTHNTSGLSNTIVGSEAGFMNETGGGNVFIGMSAGRYCEDGSYNTYIGHGASYYNVDGAFNTCIGYAAGSSATSGSSNVFLGHLAGTTETGSNKLYIANGSTAEEVLIYGDFETGRIGLGTLEPERKLHIVGDNPRILIEASSVSPEINLKNTGDATSDVWAIYKHGATDDLRFYQGGDKVTFQSGTGNVGIGTTNPGTYKLFVNGDASGTGTWGTCSDIRFKHDIKDIEDALGKIMQIRGVSFGWKTGENPEKGFDDRTHYGVIAQEVEKVLPEVVREGLEREKAVAYSELIPVLIESIKQLKAENERLSERLAAVEAQLE